MGKKLSEYLADIGGEIHDESFVDIEGTMRPITKDEALAREIWKRALGYEEETQNDDIVSHRVYSPDPKAQQFIFERREGKNIIPQDERTISLLERIDEIAKNRANKVAEQIVNNDADYGTTDPE